MANDFSLAPGGTSTWNPFKELDDLNRQIRSFFGRGELSKRKDDDFFTKADWAPLVDISEDEKEYTIKAELPDVKKEDVKVNVQNDTLSISGERKEEKEDKSKKHHRIERFYGSFERHFRIPEDADGSQVKAECKDGVLCVHLPKNPEAKPKSIEVKVD
jgi:HSP20 family protein